MGGRWSWQDGLVLERSAEIGRGSDGRATVAVSWPSTLRLEHVGACPCRKEVGGGSDTAASLCSRGATQEGCGAAATWSRARVAQGGWCGCAAVLGVPSRRRRRRPSPMHAAQIPSAMKRAHAPRQAGRLGSPLQSLPSSYFSCVGTLTAGTVGGGDFTRPREISQDYDASCGCLRPKKRFATAGYARGFNPPGTLLDA